MSSQTLLQIALVGHISGFTMMAGTILADFAISRRLNKFILSDKPKAITILDTTAGFARLIGIGAALLVLTGITMVTIFKGVVSQMLWLLFLLIFILSIFRF